MLRAIQRNKQSGAARATSLPTHIEPMLATLAVNLPNATKTYAFEWKWDGIRAIAFIKDGHLRLESRNLLDITHQYPELHELAGEIRSRNAVLDGEIIALDDAGRPSFARLQRRMHIASPATSLRLSQDVPAWYMLFDLLFLDGKSVMDESYHHRRERLEQLVPSGRSWRVPANFVGDGTAMLATARSAQMEGIVAKELDSIYESGRRSRSWLKIKVIQEQEFVVGGYVPERTGRAQRIGSLLLGYFDAAGDLQYAGRVGTGLSDVDHEIVLGLLKKHGRSTSPFAIDPAKLKPGRWTKPVKGIVYTNPAVVVQIEYRRWPDDGLVQQGAFKGVAPTKTPGRL